MRSVGLSSLKNRLREHMRRVASGETLLVTDRGRVVAEIVPPRRPRASDLAESVLADGVLEGWITAPDLERPERERCGC